MLGVKPARDLRNGPVWLLIALLNGPCAFSNEAAAGLPLDQVLAQESQAWTIGSYETPDDQRDRYFETLQQQAHALSQAYPQRAEPLIWEGIITATHAKYQNPFQALAGVRRARDVLVQALAIDAQAMDGSALITLGALYFRVPHWGSYGDDHQAQRYLEQALALDPNNIDANYFYGQLLLKLGRDDAWTYLNKAATIPPRNRSMVADQYRHAEIIRLLRTRKTTKP